MEWHIGILMLMIILENIEKYFQASILILFAPALRRAWMQRWKEKLLLYRVEPKTNWSCDYKIVMQYQLSYTVFALLVS